jgi:DNA helicase-2/ATP-dependent DNA helicase PcrA
VAFKRVVNKPVRGVGKASIGKIIQNGGNLIESIKEVKENLSSKAKKGVDEFLSIVESLKRNLEEDNLGRFVEQVCKKSKLLNYHKEQDKVAGSQKVYNMEELVNAASEYPQGLEGLLAFLEHIELDRSRITARDRENNQGVTLITMHNTKGLEFERVIITGLEEGLFPSIRGEWEDNEEIEEERRIFYVSITRAKSNLYFTSCRSRKIWGREQIFSPSRFLEEIPQDLISMNGLSPSGLDGLRQFSRGDRVYHDDFGYGNIVKVWDNGKNVFVTVYFEIGKTCQFVPKYDQHLTKVGSYYD